MLRLDPSTLFVAYALAFAVVAGVMAFYYLTQRTYPGFRDWLAGVAGVAIMLGGFSLLGEGRPDPVANVIVNALVVAGVDRFHRGTVRFGGGAPRLRPAEAIVYGAGLVAYVWWLSVNPHAPRRIVVVSLCLAFAAGRTARAAGRLARGAYRASALLLAYAMGAVAALLLAHGAAVLARLGAQPQDVVQRTPIEVLLLAACTGAAVLAALAFIILNARRTTADLEEAMAQVSQLEGIIPICMYCKKVRVDRDSWDRIEKYVSAHTQAKFSHGICPECFTREHGAL